MDYQTSEAVDLAILRIPAPSETLIDNDHGAIRTPEEVRALIRAGMAWQTTCTS